MGGYINYMVDVFTKEKRKQIMSAVKGKNTKPEKYVRSQLHRAGYRFRLQRKDLPGKPDIVLPKHRIVVFVHGCFWHGHDCPRGKRPATNRAVWNEKLDRNIQRDQENIMQLERPGWQVHTLWECKIASDTDALLAFLAKNEESKVRRIRLKT